MVIRLGEVISKKDILKKLNIAFENFHCKNEDVAIFLQEKCIEFEKRKKSCTYLIFDDNNTSNLLAYFTLSMKTIFFDLGKVPKSQIKTIDGFSTKAKHIPVLLIGQFGKDSELNPKGNGIEFLQIALEWIEIASRIIGGKTIFIETDSSENNNKVIEFYEKNGFKKLQIDNKDGFLQMYKIINN